MTPDTDPSRLPSLAHYEVIVAVCGGIAAFKVCHVVSSLVQSGASVTVAMTQAGTRFVGPETFRALSGREVLSSFGDAVDPGDTQHISLTRAADLFVIAPATANIIGKVASGICDDLVSTMVVAAKCPVMLAPAMNDTMWAHPAVVANVARVKTFGYTLVGPDAGWLACRSLGPGRMAEPDVIFNAVANQLRATPPRKTETPHQ